MNSRGGVTMVDIILFPSSFFNTKKVDEDLKKEYEAAISTGLFQIFLFGYDQWFNENKLVLTAQPESERFAVYRGWMMKPEQYELFYQQLLNRKIRLITEPAQYRLMHIFPNVYQELAGDTGKDSHIPAAYGN